VTWVDTSKLKRTVMAYNDEVRALMSHERVQVLTTLVARRLRSPMSAYCEQCSVHVVSNGASSTLVVLVCPHPPLARPGARATCTSGTCSGTRTPNAA
jgi:hypothetical protein